jgi:oligopeptide/dipeptide ABC transporter ATP-binding protein
MYLGRVVEQGPAERVVNDAKHPYTRGLLAAVPEPDPANRHRPRPVIPGEPPSALRVPTGCPFHPRCPEAMPGTCDATFPAVTRFRDGHDGSVPPLPSWRGVTGAASAWAAAGYASGRRAPPLGGYGRGRGRLAPGRLRTWAGTPRPWAATDVGGDASPRPRPARPRRGAGADRARRAARPRAR